MNKVVLFVETGDGTNCIIGSAETIPTVSFENEISFEPDIPFVSRPLEYKLTAKVKKRDWGRLFKKKPTKRTNRYVKNIIRSVNRNVKAIRYRLKEGY